ERREDQDLRRRARVGTGQPASGLDPVDVRHPDVHEDDVRLEPAYRLNRLETVGRLGHHLDVGCGLEDHAKPRPNQRLVVADDDANAHRLDSRGSLATTAYPPPGRGPAP